MTSLRFLLVIACLPLSAASADDWNYFRGPTRDGMAPSQPAPLTWSADKNIRWKTKLPDKGNSSPVVVGSHVLVTCATDAGQHRGLYCYDRAKGKLLWKAIVDYSGDDPTHMTNPYCGSSPAADAERIVVWHGSAGVHCYDQQGSKLWSRDLGEFRHIWGYGSSPVFYRDRVLLNLGPGPRQCVMALDAKTGKTLWQVEEPGGATGEDETDGKKPLWTGSWGTPVVAQIDGHDQVVVGLPHHVKAFDPQTGAVIWSCEGLGDLVYTDPLLSDGYGVVMSGYHGPAIGFKLGGSGDTTEKNRLWRITVKNPQRIGSGVLLGKHLFMANENGVAQCINVATGEELWKDRLPGAKIWSSLIDVDGRLYVSNQQGTTYVFSANPDKFELLATNELPDGTNSTFAFSDGQVFHRTFEHLYCIEDGAKAK